MHNTQRCKQLFVARIRLSVEEVAAREAHVATLIKVNSTSARQRPVPSWEYRLSRGGNTYGL